MSGSSFENQSLSTAANALPYKIRVVNPSKAWPAGTWDDKNFLPKRRSTYSIHYTQREVFGNLDLSREDADGLRKDLRFVFILKNPNGKWPKKFASRKVGMSILEPVFEKWGWALNIPQEHKGFQTLLYHLLKQEVRRGPFKPLKGATRCTWIPSSAKEIKAAKPHVQNSGKTPCKTNQVERRACSRQAQVFPSVHQTTPIYTGPPYGTGNIDQLVIDGQLYPYCLELALLPMFPIVETPEHRMADSIFCISRIDDPSRRLVSMVGNYQRANSGQRPSIYCLDHRRIFFDLEAERIFNPESDQLLLSLPRCSFHLSRVSDSSEMVPRMLLAFMERCVPISFIVGSLSPTQGRDQASAIVISD